MLERVGGKLMRVLIVAIDTTADLERMRQLDIVLLDADGG